MTPTMIQVTLVHCPEPRKVQECVLELPQGATIGQALRASAWFADAGEDGGYLPAGLTLGVWGRKSSVDHVLSEGDRVEIYRPLQVDPKVARRERFNRQGAKTAGLFAKRRNGAKAGY